MMMSLHKMSFQGMVEFMFLYFLRQTLYEYARAAEQLTHSGLDGLKWKWRYLSVCLSVAVTHTWLDVRRRGDVELQAGDEAALAFNDPQGRDLGVGAEGSCQKWHYTWSGSKGIRLRLCVTILSEHEQQIADEDFCIYFLLFLEKEKVA
jgi:hypothetical protein